MRVWIVAAFCLLVSAPGFAEVTGVIITSRTVVAGGQSFGSVGSYEKLVGKIEFALDPKDPHNAGIVDLQYAARAADGRVHFSSDLYVLQPTDVSKGNGVLYFEVSNRGRKRALTGFNRAATSEDPTTVADFGDGFLMKEGYTLVYVGWEVDVRRPQLSIDAPAVTLPSGADDTLSVGIMYNERTLEGVLIDEPAGRPPVIYPPADFTSATDRLTVRDAYWDDPVLIPRDRWRFVGDPNSIPRIRLDDGFDPGRYYQVTYRASGALAAGVGLAAIRDAASAFRYRKDLPVRGRSAYAMGNSQTARFLREFLIEGFNADERDRRTFDAMWIHVAGAARGSFNERFAIPSHGDVFRPTQFPFSDLEERDVDGARGGLQSRYASNLRPKVFYTNTPVEYWGGGRAAALTHTALDGREDLTLPKNVRIYMLAGAQHIEPAFPPPRRNGNSNVAQTADGAMGQASDRNNSEQLVNPTPQANVMRALLKALHAWASSNTAPPPSQYPHLKDGTLVSSQEIGFPVLRDVSDPRRIIGPARIVGGKRISLPHLVPAVDRDGNDRAGIRVPEVTVPLATTTGWNFRHESVGNPGDIYQLLGSYIPFARTKAQREADGDPRLSIEERYRGVDDYLRRIRTAATALIRDRYLLAEDLDNVLARARLHWDYATRDQNVAGVVR